VGPPREIQVVKLAMKNSTSLPIWKQHNWTGPVRVAEKFTWELVLKTNYGLAVAGNFNATDFESLHRVIFNRGAGGCEDPFGKQATDLPNVTAQPRIRTDGRARGIWECVTSPIPILML